MKPGGGVFTTGRRRCLIRGFSQSALLLQQIAQQVMQMPIARLQGDGAAQSVLGFHTAVAAGQQDGVASVLPRFGVSTPGRFGGLGDRFVQPPLALKDVAEQAVAVRIARRHRQREAQDGFRFLQPPVFGQQNSMSMMKPGGGVFTTSRRRRFIDGFGQAVLTFEDFAELVTAMSVFRVHRQVVSQAGFSFLDLPAADQKLGISRLLPGPRVGAVERLGGLGDRLVQTSLALQDVAEQALAIGVVRLHRQRLAQADFRLGQISVVGQQGRKPDMLPGRGIGASARFARFRDRFAHAPLAFQDIAEQVVAVGVGWIHRQGVAHAGLGLYELAPARQQGAVSRVLPSPCIGATERFGGFVERLIQTSLALEQFAEQIVTMCVVAVEGDGFTQVAFGFLGSPGGVQKDRVSDVVRRFDIFAGDRRRSLIDRLVQAPLKLENLTEKMLAMSVPLLKGDRSADVLLGLHQTGLAKQQLGATLKIPR